MVKVVCFDVGGVLIRIAHFWLDAAAHAQVSVRPEILPTATLSDSPLFGAYQRGAVSEEVYLTDLMDYLGLASLDEADLVHRHIMIEPFPEVDRIVKWLNLAGILTACLSNTNGPHWREMTESGRFPANEMLRLRMASHELRLEKPDLAIFRAFEARAGESGKDILFFDDSKENVEAAASLGWNSVWIDSELDPGAQIKRTLAKNGILV